MIAFDERSSIKSFKKSMLSLFGCNPSEPNNLLMVLFWSNLDEASTARSLQTISSNHIDIVTTGVYSITNNT